MRPLTVIESKSYSTFQARCTSTPLEATRGQVVSDRHLAVHQTTVSACVRAVATTVVCHLGP